MLVLEPLGLLKADGDRSRPFTGNNYLPTVLRGSTLQSLQTSTPGGGGGFSVLHTSQQRTRIG